MGLFRPLNRGQTLEFSASWALGPKPTGNRHQPGLGHLGDIHTDTKVNGTHPSALKDKGIPVWERRTEGRWANSARVCP